MAKIEDLVSRIEDESLRAAIGAEVKELKKTKRFGLVFEEHLPETVRLPNVPIRKGCLVAKKAETGNACWEVKEVRKGNAECKPLGTNKYEQDKVSFPVDELVVVKPFGEPIFPTLRPIDRVSRGGPDKPWHTLINADNFHALQLLLYCYEGQIDVIYIDPPYNTGAKDWKYNNNYVEEADLWRHSKWLSMMKKRLMMSKKLLKPDGVIVVTIDEYESHSLGLLIREIFGSENALGDVTIVINPSGQVTKRKIASTHEYAFFHGRSISSEIKKRNISAYEAKSFKREDAKGAYKARELRRTGAKSERDYPGNRGLWYPIYASGVPKDSGVYELTKEIKLTLEPSEVSEELWPIDPKGVERVWRIGQAEFENMLSGGELAVKRVKGRIEPVTKSRPSPQEIRTVWDITAYYSANGKRIMKNLTGHDGFTYPKSPYAVMECIQTAARDKKDAVILDFFAGSGTTFHAAALLNAEDNGKRQSIIITNNEVGHDAARKLQKSGKFPGDTEYEKHGICEHTTWPRCKNSIQGRLANGEKVNGRYLDRSQISDGLEENMEYFLLDFIDSSDVERGDAFEGILPILWMMAGCIGEREDRRGTTPFYIAKHSPFAVLIKEGHFAEFAGKLREREDIKHVFLVTDAEENFAMMRRELGGSYSCYQLYKSYLENFRLNAADPSLTGTKA